MLLKVIKTVEEMIYSPLV